MNPAPSGSDPDLAHALDLAATLTRVLARARDLHDCLKGMERVMSTTPSCTRVTRYT